MDQNRSENGTSQQQNVHLHMHHVCNCQGGIYPAYYPTVGYRTPLPSLVPYHTPSAAVARPYLQHYQYTQFNMGSQYTVPIGHVTGSSTSVYGPTTSGANTIDLVYGGATIKERRDREEGSGDTEKGNEPPEGYDYGQITPPANELLVTDPCESTNQENFVKFLERSCLTAEQIAYRNRNRPCFRNIQNLCIRTRSEILKPCTTISNIHSQGIPWATKDFIYAFVRLTNCWHILKGYWENRDGSSLGKIEKELTPEFRSCYVRWEKETIELAGQLTKIFYNLDTNLNIASSGASVYSANNLIPPQINLIKSTSEGAIKNQTTSSDTATTSTLTNGSSSSKNIRGIVHLPSTGSPTTETVDQANQTYSSDFCTKEDEYESEEERTRRVYMKPGSYNVPKKGLEGTTSGNSPRVIEFLETAQNVNKARETVNERYWANGYLSGLKKPSLEYKIMQEEEEKRQDIVDMELNLSTQLNVHEWLISSNFAEFGDTKSSMSQQELKSFYLDSAYDTLPQLDTSISLDNKNQSTTPVTVLQRGKCSLSQPSKLSNGCGTKTLTNGRIELNPSKTFRKHRGTTTTMSMATEAQRRGLNPYELKSGGLTEVSQCILENVIGSLKSHILGPVVVDTEMDLEKVLQKLKNMEYSYVNEVVRDLKYIIKLWDEVDIHNTGWFSQKLDLLLVENFSPFDFGDIKGDPNELVGPLKNSMATIFSSDCDQFI